MTRKSAIPVLKVAVVAVFAVALTGCNTLWRLSEVGDHPKLSQIDNPTTQPGYKPVNLPLPAPAPSETNPNSLWRAGAKGFFKDERASKVGDIVTVSLDLSDSASWANSTTAARKDSESDNVTNLLGYESEFSKVLPDAVDPAAIANFGNTHSTSGDGTISRKEQLNLTVAAVITQVLPNGHLVLMGRQEIRVNDELRQLMVTGVIRPEDIDSNDTITYDKIAEMRVAYGGRGTLSDLQQPRWGTQLWDILFPF